MKKSITTKIETLLNAMVNGSSAETLKSIIRGSTNETSRTDENEKKQNSYPYKFIQILR